MDNTRPEARTTSRSIVDEAFVEHSAFCSEALASLPPLPSTKIDWSTPALALVGLVFFPVLSLLV